MKNIERRKKLKKQTLLKVAHDMAKGLHKVNAIDATAMREFEVLCLPPKRKTPERYIA